MHSLLNIALISWENIFNAEFSEKLNGTDIRFYDTKPLQFTYKGQWTDTEIQCHNRHSLPAT